MKQEPRSMKPFAWSRPSALNSGSRPSVSVYLLHPLLIGILIFLSVDVPYFVPPLHQRTSQTVAQDSQRQPRFNELARHRNSSQVPF
jgi:hypothetical protein